MPPLVPSFAALLACCALAAQDPVLADPRFAAGSVVVEGQRYPYRLLEPLPHLRTEDRPLVVFLHGAGERGDDNTRQLAHLPERLAEPALRERFPCFVLAVQCPADERWVEVAWSEQSPARAAPAPTRAATAVLAALDELIRTRHVDRSRVYLVGLSMGGFGAWDLAARAPQRFAALLAVCGGGDPATAPRLVGLPVAVWHGTGDRVVPVERSRQMVAALGNAFGAVEYRELPDVGHDVWRQAFADDGALPWLFAQDQRQQRRGLFAEPPLVPQPDDARWGKGAFMLQPTARCVVTPAVRDVATAFVAALAPPERLVPGVVEGAAPADGDLVFTIDPAQADAAVVEVTRQLRITGRDLRGLHRAAALAAQLLRAELACAHGALRVRHVATGNRLVLPADATTWTKRVLHDIADDCWLFGVDELALGYAAPAADGEWSEFARALAVRGVRQVTLQSPLVDGAHRWRGDAAALLREPGAEAGGVRPFALELWAVEERGARAALASRLPAAIERAHHRGPIHVGGFRSRLGQLQR